MPKIQKNIRIDSEVNKMLDQIIFAQEEILSIKLSQAAMIEYLIRNEFKSLGLDQQLPNGSEPK